VRLLVSEQYIDSIMHGATIKVIQIFNLKIYKHLNQWTADIL